MKTEDNQAAKTDSTKPQEDSKPKQEEPKITQTSNEQDQNKINKLINSVGSVDVSSIINKFKPVFNAVSNVIEVVAPKVIIAYNTVYDTYNKLPMDIIYAIFGLVLVFFGGSFAMTLVAFEAFMASGWETVRRNGETLYKTLYDLWVKSKEDDKVDANNDGVADVNQKTVKELIYHKVQFFFYNVKDPGVIMDMVAGIGQCFISVISVLKLDFAKILALGNSIGEQLKKSAQSFLVPILASAIPKDYHQWIAPIINYLCKAVAISIAFIVQRIISAVQSGIRGGLMFSRRILKFLSERGHINFKEDESNLDEILGWSLAFLGVSFQIMNGFSVPFPLNLIVFPLTFLENILQWVVTYTIS